MEWEIDFFTKDRSILERAPQRSRAHRITAPKEGGGGLSSGGWRLFFSVTEDLVSVIHIAPGFPKRILIREGFEVVPDWQAQLAFRERWTDE